jgi:NADH-quinone oxidoreductase subunit N
VTDVLSWLAALTMVVGNIGALAQISVKRLLAYSSVSHAGYVLAGVAALAGAGEGAGGPLSMETAAAAAKSAVLFYLVIYTLMNLGAFGVLSAVETSDATGLTFEDLGGLKQRHPVLTACILLFMLSLAGVPPTGGFLAKWRIFEVLVDRLNATHDRSWLVLIIFLAANSVVGLAYHLRVIMAMYMSPSPARLPIYPRPAWSTAFTIILCAAPTLWLGFGPSFFFGLGAEGALSWVRSAAG